MSNYNCLTMTVLRRRHANYRELTSLINIAGQRATVKAEMNGFTPGLDLRPLSRWMGGQGGQSLKVLGRSLSDFGAFLF